jgi:electron-transferring-flavoprotein dehydrogenase
MTSDLRSTVERQTMDVDIACVGFGPAMGGFLTTLNQALSAGDGSLESSVMPGMPLQVICYERADDLGFGVSGVVTRADGIRKSFPELDPREIPLATPVKHEEVLYLLDPHGVSRRSSFLRFADSCIRALKGILPFQREAFKLPYIPHFLSKEGGLLLSIGQFNQWVATQLMGSGTVQIWPGQPVAEPLYTEQGLAGVRLVDQGTDRQGRPEPGFMAGADIHAGLTVVGDGPVGTVGRQIDQHFGMPSGHHKRDWAVGMKMVVDLPENCQLQEGTVLHTFGYPEPEIFGFMYVYPDRVASLGIFVPSWFDSPVRTAYRYLQHWMLHPYLWKHLEGATLRSWGAKTLEEAGKRGEPYLVGDGYARIGESSGSTNMLINSGVDEAWVTGVQLAESVIELAKAKKPFTKENLDATYVKRRRDSHIERNARLAEKSRDGFQRGFVQGMLGVALSGFTGGRLAINQEPVQPYKRIPNLAEYYKGRLTPEEIEKIQQDCAARGVSAHAELMELCGWPKIPYDGKLLVSHQDALLMGGKVQAPPGYADHVVFLYPELCQHCGTKICVEVCSGQAITPGANGVPVFDREKCIHCVACLWSCSTPHPQDPERSVIDFRAGTGGLHTADN